MNGWKKRRLGVLLKLTSGQSPSGFKFGSVGTPYYKVDQLGKADKYLTRQSTPYFSKTVPKVPANSVLIAKRGAAIALDRVRLLTEPSFMDTNVMALTPIDAGLEAAYLYYWLRQRGLWDVADVTSVPQINNKHINPLEISLPSPEEQRRIVDVLRDADELVAALHRLVAKKQAIKQGMAQKLLTGRTRLPGFQQEWIESNLGTIASVNMGQSPPGASYNASRAGVPLIQGNADVKDRCTVERVWTTQPSKHCTAGDVIVTVRAPVGYIAVASTDACIGRGVCSLHASDDNRFLYHALVYAEPRWRIFEQGSTFTSVNSAQVRLFPLRWPTDPSERGEIASVLDEVDEDLRFLQLRLEKAKAIKQGMAQELLTGKTRLPVLEAV